MITLLQEIWAIIIALWNTGNRMVRWALVIFVSWPLVTIVSAISVPLFVPYIVLLPLFAIVFLFIAWLDPLVVVAIVAFPKGRTVLKWLAGIIAVELIIGIYFSVVPVINNPGFVPLLILVIAAMAFLFISPAKAKWGKRALYALVVIITLSFFIPNTMKSIGEKSEKWDKETAVSILEEKPKPFPPPPRAAVAAVEEFHLNAGEEILTVLVGPNTYHVAHANKPFLVLARQPDGSQKAYEAPAGDSSWEGVEPRGLLRIKGILDETIVRFRKV